MEKLNNIRGNIYIGQPLIAFTFDGKYWCGQSNFLTSNQKNPTIYLANLDHCFKLMKYWLNNSYLYGYILDFENKTVYYDAEEALEHLKKKKFPKWNLEDYFENFIKQDFAAIESCS